MLNLDGAPLPLQAVVGLGIALSLGELGSMISTSVSGSGASTTPPAEIQNNDGQKDTPMMARAHHPEIEDGSGTATVGKKRKISIGEGDGNGDGSIEVETSNKKPKVLIDGERLLEEFTCPISLGLPIDPVIAEDGR